MVAVTSTLTEHQTLQKTKLYGISINSINEQISLENCFKLFL